MRTTNPTLNDSTFREWVRTAANTDVTLDGTVNKCLALVGLAILSATYTWNVSHMNERAGVAWIAVGAIGGLIVAVTTVFRKHWSQYTAPAYAVLEGLALGALSSRFDVQYPGIVVQCVGLTFGTLLVLLLAYKSRVIEPSENFRLGVVAATGAIALMYMMKLILALWGVTLGEWGQSGWVGIGLSGFIVVIAALNLVLDFDFIESGVAQGGAKYMEWYAAFGLLVTLGWLYVEILRLLAKLANRK
jgi:uncharacterized YccA/Bax inhibitor family protein